MSLLFCRLLCLQLWPLPLTSSRMQLFRVVPNTSPQPARRREEQNSKPAPASMAELGTPSLYEYCHQSTQQNGVTTDPQPLAGSRMARPFFSIGGLHGNINTDRARPTLNHPCASGLPRGLRQRSDQEQATAEIHRSVAFRGNVEAWAASTRGSRAVGGRLRGSWIHGLLIWDGRFEKLPSCAPSDLTKPLPPRSSLTMQRVAGDGE
jgi:hypothetical protein